MIVAQVYTLVLTQSDTYTVFPFQSTYMHKAFHLLVSNLALAKSVAVGKTSRQLYCSIGYCTGHILHGHVAIITKLSPHHILTMSTISGPRGSNGTRPSPDFSPWLRDKIPAFKLAKDSTTTR